MLSTLRRLMNDMHANAAIEYSLIALLISTVAVVAVTDVGHKVLNMLGPAAIALT